MTTLKTIKFLLIIIIYFISNNVFSQDDYMNLKKYWSYRERLKKYVYVSHNYTEPGTNIPAERISPDYSTLIWDDGNGAFNQYISVLATEYRLLKTYHQDYSQTIKELYYALKSFERLDTYADMEYRNPKVHKLGDLNGFFRRNDVDSLFWDKYKKGGSHSYFSQQFIDEGDTQQNSLDNCIHYLESFSLVNALVDNEIVDGKEINFKQIVKENTRRIIKNMYHPNDIIPFINIPLLDKLHFYSWYLRNPVTGELVPNKYGGGLDGTMLYASYGFKKIADNILQSEEFDEMRFSYEIYRILLLNPITEMNFDDYKVRALCALGNINIIKELSPYRILIKKQKESKKYIYEQFPFIWSVIYDKTDMINNEERSYIKYLLDAAPFEGPYKILENDSLKYGNVNWSSESRLIWPENLNKNTNLGYYNGLDYMLLHNLYLLTNNKFFENLYLYDMFQMYTILTK